MLSEILNLVGVEVLSKSQQLKIGGGQSCTFTYTRTDGTTETETYSGFSAGSAGSSQANDTCVNNLANSSELTRCQYDCEWDDNVLMA